MKKLSLQKIKIAQSKGMNKIRDILNNETVRIVSRVAADNSGTFQKLAKDPNLLNIALAISGVSNSLYNAIDLHSNEFFEDGTWDYFMGSSVVSLFIPVMVKNASRSEQFSLSDKQVRVRIFHFDNEDFVLGCLQNENETFSNLYIKASLKNWDAVKASLCKMFWLFHEKKSLLITSVKTTGRWSEDHLQLHASIDTVSTPLHSELADNQARNISRAMKCNIHRAILYYGPPGTGKSTLCRSVIAKLNLSAVRIRYNDLYGNADLWNIVGSLGADAVIIDDLDRCETEKLLELLENLQKHVKVVLATANNRNSIDEACLRPGRFDELINVTHLDENVVKEVLGTDAGAAFDAVKQWPIAFIQEYKKRRTYMEHDEALATMKELAARVDRLSQYDESDFQETEIFSNKLFKKGKSSKKS